MTSFEKYQASAEARRGTHGDHLDQLTGYFLAETNRLREKNEEVPKQQAGEPVSEPPPPPPQQRKRFRWWRWWRRG